MASQIMKDRLAAAQRRLEYCKKAKEEAERAIERQTEIIDELELQLPKQDQHESRRKYIAHSQKQQLAEAKAMKRLASLTDIEIAALKKILAD